MANLKANDFLMRLLAEPLSMNAGIDKASEKIDICGTQVSTLRDLGNAKAGSSTICSLPSLKMDLLVVDWDQSPDDRLLLHP